MAEVNHAVAHYLDGRVLKGTTDDFLPNRPQFHLHPHGPGTPEVVVCRELKALFFVREFGGDPGRKDIHGFGLVSGEANQGKKIAVRFKDGEVLFGYTLSYTPEREGFFLVPADPGSNNIRIYVLKHATQKIFVGLQAEDFARSGGSQAA